MHVISTMVRSVLAIGLCLYGCSDDAGTRKSQADAVDAMALDAASRGVDGRDVQEVPDAGTQSVDTGASEDAYAPDSSDAAADATRAADATIDAVAVPDARADAGVAPDAAAPGDAAPGPRSVQEGTRTTPKDITGLLPYQGYQDGAGSSHYVVTGLQPNTIYTVTMTHLEGRSGPIVDDAVGSGTVMCTPDSGQNTVSCAAVTDDAGNLVFRTFRSDPNPVTFLIDVAEGGIVNEGTALDPVVIDQVPFSGGMLSKSYYVVTGLTPGAAYTVTKTVSGSSDPVVSIYPDATYDTQGGQRVCVVWSSNTACVYEADAAGNLYIGVRENEHTWGVNYTLDVVPGGIPDQGGELVPRDITGVVPYAGSVNNEESYYRITGLDPSLVYTLTASGVSDRIAMTMTGQGRDVGSLQYSNCEAANQSTEDVVCAAYPAADGALDIKIDGNRSVDGSMFTLDLVQGGLANEGYSTLPVDLAGSLPHDGQVHYGGSFYEISGLQVGQDYTVTLTNLSADVELRVTVPSCQSNNPNLVAESCAVRATSDTLRIEVWYTGSPHGATFTLDVQ